MRLSKGHKLGTEWTLRGKDLTQEWRGDHSVCSGSLYFQRSWMPW